MENEMIVIVYGCMIVNRPLIINKIKKYNEIRVYRFSFSIIKYKLIYILFVYT